MSSRLLSPAMLVLAVSLAGCVPRPHVVHLRPAVQGVILEDGKPVPGAELYLGKFAGANEPCAEVGEGIPVSPEGGFAWPSIQEHRLTDSLLNPLEVRGMITVLCIRHPAKGILIGATLIMMQSRPLSVTLACNLARPYSHNGPNIGSHLLGGTQYCQVNTPA